MEVSRSWYYDYKKERLNKREHPEELELIIKIKEWDKKTCSSYGSRRISKALKAQGHKVGRYKARNLMKKADVLCKQRRKYKKTTTSHSHLWAAENKLNRQFKVDAPNHTWVCDITYFWTSEGWLFLAAVLDLFSRKIVGWSIAEEMRTELVSNALSMAMRRRNPKAGLVHHSDRGCQYSSHEYQSYLKEQGILVSMSRKGNCWDNSVMERFFGSLKSERIHLKGYRTRDQTKSDIIDYIEMFYNSKRLHSYLGYKSPIQFEEEYCSPLG